jgi:hypothetical protein
MWKPDHRFAVDRAWFALSWRFDCAEWAIVEPMMTTARHRGRNHP